MADSIKYTGVSGKYTKNGIPNGFTTITLPEMTIGFYTPGGWLEAFLRLCHQ